MEDVRIIGNIGLVKGGDNGDGMVYAGKTAGGTYMAIVMHQDLVNNVLTDVPRYYRKSVLQNLIDVQNAFLAADFNKALLTDQAAPAFIDAADTSFWPKVLTVTNGSTAIRKFSGQDPYTVKGEGVTAADVEALKSGAGTGTGTGGGLIGGSTPGTTATGAMGDFVPKDFSLLFSNPIKFIQDNALFVGIVLAVIYWSRRKKKKPLWIF